MDREDEVKGKLEELQSKVGKKQTFEEAVSSIRSLLRDFYPSASPLLRKSFYSVVCRVATILKTRHTALGFWNVGLGLFLEATQFVSELSEREKLQSFISQAQEELREVESQSNGLGSAQNRPNGGFLFDGHLTVDPEPPQPEWLVQSNLLTAVGTLFAAESSQGEIGHGSISENAARLVQELVDGLHNVMPMTLEDDPVSSRARPPASKEAVANLPVATLTEELLAKTGLDAECAICKEKLILNDKMQELPCAHIFHPPCLKPWLEEHNTCPICRHELQTDDHAYESRKEQEKEAEEERRGAANAVRGGEYIKYMSSSPSFHSAMNTPSKTAFDEHRWVIQIRRTLDDGVEEEYDFPVSIFSVPRPLLLIDPDCYLPQQIAVGPYHHWRPELFEMERYKLTSAKRLQKNLRENLKFHDLVDQITRLEPRIRACYHRYLDFNGETLAWMMAVNASFLLEFLQIYAVKEGKILTRISSRMSHLVDVSGRKSGHNAILRDLLMLENQIPLFLLREVLEFQHLSSESADAILISMLIGLCKDLSPFKMQELPDLNVSEASHLLDFLYRLIVPRTENRPETVEIEEIIDAEREAEQKLTGNANYFGQCLNVAWKILSKLNRGPIRLIKRILLAQPVKLVLKLPWTIVSNLPGFRLLKQQVEYFFSAGEKKKGNPENENENSNNKPPLVEEITIPSVTELSEAGIKFSPSYDGIKTISFDARKLTLYLPTVSLDVNTGVIFRNLVAYESCNASGPLVITRYTELMNGIIDTEEDVKFLRERGILMNRLKSDVEAAALWNGMSKSVRLTKVPLLDGVIEDVNKYYNRQWKVKMGKFTKMYIFGSWQFLTLLAAVVLLLLMCLQAFCSVYSCSRIFHRIHNVE